MRIISFRVLSAVSIVLLLAVAAVASDADDVMKPVHQFVDGSNKGDAKTALAACAEQAYIIDDFPPYEWHGQGACATWATDYAANAQQNGITDPVLTLGKPKHVEISGDYAYVVVPATYAFKQHGKQVKQPNSMLTAALHKDSSGWRITSWTWSMN